MDIFVGSLSFKLKESELREAFEKYGKVSSAKIIIDKITRQSKGFGFVEMPDDEEARLAINNLNGAEMYGRPLVVNESQKKESREGGAPREFRREGFNRPRPAGESGSTGSGYSTNRPASTDRPGGTPEAPGTGFGGGGSFDRGPAPGGNTDRYRSSDKSSHNSYNDRNNHGKSKYDDRGKGEYTKKGGGGSKKSYGKYQDEDEDDFY